MEANEGWPGIASAAAGGTIRAMRRSVLLVDDHASFRAEARAILEPAGEDHRRVLAVLAYLQGR